MNVSVLANINRFYFDANVVSPLVILKKELRSGLEYDNDLHATKTALIYFKNISDCFAGNAYLLSASQEIAKSNSLRAKKGVLWKEKDLRNLESRSAEISVSSNDTRLISLVNLNSFHYDSAESLILNWAYSLILLSMDDIDTLSERVFNWVSKDARSVLAYDFESAAADLLVLETTAILRYFPADNGRDETLIAVGNKNFIESQIIECLNVK